MSRAFRRGLALGAASGLAAVLLAEAMRPRAGSAELLDWDEVTRVAIRRLRGGRIAAPALAEAAVRYNRFAGEVRGLGRAGLTRYVALTLEFLGRRVLGQFDPKLLGREPVRSALYLVEPNVAAWEEQEQLPGDDLRRWLILHEMTHAWQFEGRPWLREHLNEQIGALVELAARGASGGARDLGRVRAITMGVPSQWALVRRLQATMSLVEGHGNLVMSRVGRRVLASFDAIDAAYRRRGRERGLLEQLAIRLTGLEVKMEQYRVGEQFARTVHDRYGMDVLNRAWEGPDTLPRAEELRDPERWRRRLEGWSIETEGECRR